jgi:hypothetical protein
MVDANWFSSGHLQPPTDLSTISGVSIFVFVPPDGPGIGRYWILTTIDSAAARSRSPVYAGVCLLRISNP